MQQTILILAANPKDTKRLRLDEEVREIDAGLRRAKQRDQFILEQKWAVQPRDIYQAMLDTNPSIIHFSGHGMGDEGLVFEDETGSANLVHSEALAELFSLFADRLECIVLNGCYSEVQANAIAQHINYVIGMSKAIGDRAAIKFAVGFYDALGAGKRVEFAYKLGCAAIRLAGIPEQLTPILKRGREPDKPKETKSQIVGDWAWDRRAFPATIRENGTVIGKDGGQIIHANWHYIGDKKDKIEVEWNTEFIDTLILTENGNALIGCNNGGGELVIIRRSRRSSRNSCSGNVSCSRVIGDWSWDQRKFPASIYEDGTVLANDGSQDGKGILIRAKWTCHYHNQGEIRVEWETDFTDILTLSPDYNTLTGASFHRGNSGPLVVTRR
ncbi:CHAT domain-containing protein [Aetokthonos hydrillicola Thurmond2011]|jgi:hypothetical protein|uniref:CHAT domain-containing protein n=1 Tax=Aetokthonos hydrillicola Thurmond2011 TaxID=2712845 RepID=A0AAP5MCE6_9CYAN|nr:CHAT domain-containing protein [Aetokthonos hydrillicola]MDR9900245.1 CHAT domain-containing protein [Aetokthonos hydrillicola Thurmond2011]